MSSTHKRHDPHGYNLRQSMPLSEKERMDFILAAGKARTERVRLLMEPMCLLVAFAMACLTIAFCVYTICA